MKAKQTTFDTENSCPHCGETTSVVKLGSEPAREICPTLPCEWEGITLE
jgi:transcription elongation factor Elf1